MPDGLWREQVAYYRRRAAEYDATSYGGPSTWPPMHAP